MSQGPGAYKQKEKSAGSLLFTSEDEAGISIIRKNRSIHLDTPALLASRD